MTHYLLDTNHASGVLTGKLDLLRHPKRPTDAEFGIALPSIGELWFMVFNSRRSAENANSLQQLLDQFRHYHFDANAAIDFGKIMTDRRRAGRPIAGIDCQIAAIARTNDLTLLTDDSDFVPIANLKLDNWLR